jgi:hypothetical protein
MLKLMKIKYLLLALTLPMVTFFGSCQPSGSDSPTRISLENGPGLISDNTTAMADSLLTFSISASAMMAMDFAGTIQTISASYSINGKSAVPILDSTISSSSSLSILFQHRLVGNVADVVKYTFVATEVNGNSAKTSVEITVNPTPAPLKIITENFVYNTLESWYKCAFDLSKGVGLTKYDTLISKDLMDKTIAGPLGDAQFSKKWGSGNFTRFVKISSNDYINAKTTNDLYDLWNLNGIFATLQTATLAKGDVYLVKSGQDLPFNLYIIAITEIQDITNIGNNLDYVKFNYKKIDN